MRLNRIGIVGLGLIGGSIGLDLQNLDYEVYGLVNHEKNLVKARERKLAQVISTDPKILCECSLIILALPISQLLDPHSNLIEALPTKAVVTDVASVKSPIIDVWRELHPKFVASHPMAGTIDKGVEAGRNELFINRPWVATPEETTDPEALRTVHDLAVELGSHWITTDPKTHDQAVALISHLPLFTSAALLQTLCKEKNETLLSLAKKMASTGFADTTRVGGGNPDLGISIASNNSSALLEAIKLYRLSIENLETLIHKKQWTKLHQELKENQLIRDEFL